jgi:hypothetical protein
VTDSKVAGRLAQRPVRPFPTGHDAESNPVTFRAKQASYGLQLSTDKLRHTRYKRSHPR